MEIYNIDFDKNMLDKGRGQFLESSDIKRALPYPV